MTDELKELVDLLAYSMIDDLTTGGYYRLIYLLLDYWSSIQQLGKSKDEPEEVKI